MSQWSSTKLTGYKWLVLYISRSALLSAIPIMLIPLQNEKEEISESINVKTNNSFGVIQSTRSSEHPIGTTILAENPPDQHGSLQS
jgi:hypothetical protein